MTIHAPAIGRSTSRSAFTLIEMLARHAKPNGRSTSRSAFTLIEMLVVVGIILLLLALLLPTIQGTMLRAMRITCLNNMRQVYSISVNYGGDHKGFLPLGNARNPMTFTYILGEKVEAYMKAQGIPPDVWYCPGNYRQYYKITPYYWMNRNERPFGATDEFTIGIMYTGNPDYSARYKYKIDIPNKLEQMSTKGVVAADICHTSRPSPYKGEEVTSWLRFAHDRYDRPAVCNTLMGDGSVEARRIEQITRNYGYNPAQVDAFW